MTLAISLFGTVVSKDWEDPSEYLIDLHTLKKVALITKELPEWRAEIRKDLFCFTLQNKPQKICRVDLLGDYSLLRERLRTDARTSQYVHMPPCSYDDIFVIYAPPEISLKRGTCSVTIDGHGWKIDGEASCKFVEEEIKEFADIILEEIQ